MTVIVNIDLYTSVFSCAILLALRQRGPSIFDGLLSIMEVVTMNLKHLANQYQKSVSGSVISEAIKGADEMNDLIDFSIGDPDFNTDLEIIERTFESVKAGATHYTDPQGVLKLREKLTEFYQDTYDVTIKPEEIMITTSGCHAMVLTLMAILNPEDEFILLEPYFSLYKEQVELAGGRVVPCPSDPDKGFRVDLNKLASCITKRTKAVILNTPCNPSGVCMTLDEMKQFAKVIIDHDLLVIADDIYTLYSYETAFVPIMSLEGMRERTITVSSFSKDYCMTGWRIGYIAADAEFIQIVKKINDAVIYSAPAPSQWAAIHALELRDKVQPKLKAEFAKRCTYAYERINACPYLSVSKPQGSIYLFVDIRKTGCTSKQFCQLLLTKAHILVLPGDDSGQSGEGFVRFAMTLGIDKMKVAFDRIDTLTLADFVL